MASDRKMPPPAAVEGSAEQSTVTVLNEPAAGHVPDGIVPEVARILVNMGIDLSTIQAGGPLYTQALERLAAETPDEQVCNIIDPASAPLLKMLMAYREKVDTLEQSRKKLYQLAHYDPLTGLPNRAAFFDRLSTALSQASRFGRQIAVMSIDLDRFKMINGTRGHTIGDKLLVKVAECLNECVHEEDTVARLSGDEFTIILNEINKKERTERVAGRIVERLSRAFLLEGHDVFISASVGISIFPFDGVDAETLLRCAGTAMHHAKEDGKNTFRFFDWEMNAGTMERLTLETSLRHALNKNELSVNYQPKVDMTRKEIVGVESLLRWHNDKIGMVSPGRFIPVAEETGLIVGIGEFVLRETCKQAVLWREEGLGEMPVAVNLSARQFKDKYLLEVITGVLEETALEPGLLEIELTESLVMDDVENNIMVLKKLKEIGLRISIDDFGTGYSSLSYLRRLPVDTIKIDQSFIKDITTDQNSKEIVSMIISMAINMNLKVIAEGVETPEQVELLLNWGCREGQGFYFCKPVPGDSIRSAVDEAHSVSFPAAAGRVMNL